MLPNAGMYRRALMRGVYSACVALSILWLTCDKFDTEPVAALTIGTLVSMFDWIDIAFEERRRKRIANVERERDRDTAGSLHVPAFLVSIACLCAILLSASSVAHAFYRPDSIETVTGPDESGRTQTVKSYRSPWATGIQFEAEHARRAIKAAEAAGDVKR